MFDALLQVLDTTLVGPLKVWMLLGMILFQVLKNLMTAGSGRKVCASHILVKDEKNCLEIKAKILAKSTRAL